MFGFKTKKDKKIESQAEEIKQLNEKLYEILYVTRFKQPRLYQQNAKVETITAMQMVEPGMPIDLVKSKIVAMMIAELKDKIYYDVEQDERTQNIVLRGYLNYVIDYETR